MKRLVVVLLFAIGIPAAHAQVGPPVPVTGTIIPIATGPGAQVDSHISGARVSITNRAEGGGTVDVFDMVSGVRSAVDHDATIVDFLSDISGNTVVFVRQFNFSMQEIAFVTLDGANHPSTVTVLAPDASASRSYPRIGGDTVAFQQFTTNSSFGSAICVASVSHPTEPAQCLTDQTRLNQHPDVSPDGNVVVFQSCSGDSAFACDIYSTRRNLDGTWSTPIALTSGGPIEYDPKTNGTIVVYNSAGEGESDIYYAPVTGAGPATKLKVAPLSSENGVSISGTMIAFQSTLQGEDFPDIYLFDTATNTLFQLPPTPDMQEGLADVSVAADGTVRVVWSQVDPLDPTVDYDVYAMSFNLNRASYAVCPLFDASRSFKAGRVAPLKIQLCGSNGSNLSDPARVLTATGLVQLDNSASTVLELESAGQANSDGVFRYDASLRGYIFNLSTAGLTTGTWELRFRVSGDNAVYGIKFDVR